jgi:hypothetical protein
MTDDCGAENYLRLHQLCSHSIVAQHFIEPKGSLPHLQELSTCTYPEPDQYSPHHPILSLKDPAHHYPPTYILVFFFRKMFTYTDFTDVSFKHILIRWTNFMGSPSCMKILYNTSLLTES